MRARCTRNAHTPSAARSDMSRISLSRSDTLYRFPSIPLGSPLHVRSIGIPVFLPGSCDANKRHDDAPGVFAEREMVSARSLIASDAHTAPTYLLADSLRSITMRAATQRLSSISIFTSSSPLRPHTGRATNQNYIISLAILVPCRGPTTAFCMSFSA